MQSPFQSPSDRMRSSRDGPSTWLPEGRHDTLAAVLLATLLIAIYGGSLTNGWINWDDPLHVTANPYLTPFTCDHLGALWQAPYEYLYIPVSYTIFGCEAVAARVFANLPADAIPPAPLFHALSLGLHIACTLLVGSLLKQLVGDGLPRLAGALLFGLHPLQVESVAWISEQRGLLATLFGLLAIHAHLASRFNDGCARHATAFRMVSSAGATLAFAMALLCKPSAACLPAVALCLAVGRTDQRRRLRAALLPLVPWTLLAGMSLGYTSMLQTAASMAHTPWLLRPVVAGHAIGFYLWKVVCPWGLCIDYGLTPHAVLAATGTFAVAAAVWAAAVLIAIAPSLSRARIPALLFLLPLAPVLGFVPFLFQGISTVADRYMYVAMLGPACGLGLMVSRLPRVAKPAVVVAMTVGLGFLSCLQTATWHDSFIVNRHALAVNGGTSTTLNNLGMALLDAEQNKQALIAFKRAVVADATNDKAYLNLGIAHHRLGFQSQAEHAYRDAIRRKPTYAKAYNNLGILLAEMGRVAEARDCFSRALALDDTLAESRLNLDQAEELMRRQPPMAPAMETVPAAAGP